MKLSAIYTFPLSRRQLFIFILYTFCSYFATANKNSFFIFVRYIRWHRCSLASSASGRYNSVSFKMGLFSCHLLKTLSRKIELLHFIWHTHSIIFGTNLWICINHWHTITSEIFLPCTLNLGHYELLSTISRFIFAIFTAYLRILFVGLLSAFTRLTRV